MTRPLDALAEAMKAEFGAWGECKMPCDPNDAWRSVARVCLRVIGEGKVLAERDIAQRIHDRLCRSNRHHECDDADGWLDAARAILRAFREAGEE